MFLVNVLNIFRGDLRFSQRWLWRVSSSGIWCCVVCWVANHVSEEHIACHLLVLAEIISSTLKMEAICSSETSVATQQTTRRHIPEDDTLNFLRGLWFSVIPKMRTSLVNSPLLIISHYVRFKVLTSVTMKIPTSWVVKPRRVAAATLLPRLASYLIGLLLWRPHRMHRPSLPSCFTPFPFTGSPTPFSPSWLTLLRLESLPRC
jgi:hypothetical protein